MPYIYGQLLNAQFEFSSGGAPALGGSPLGRVYIDGTSTIHAVPYYFDGTSYVTFGGSLATLNTSSTASYNPGGANELIYDTSGSVLATLTLNLPTVTSIGQIVKYATLSGVTTLSMTYNGLAVGVAPTSLAANQVISFQAVDTAGTFIRIQ